MGQNAKASVEIQLPSEAIENKEKNQTEESGIIQEMPTVTSLLRRKKLALPNSESTKMSANSSQPTPSDETPQVQPAKRRSKAAVVAVATPTNATQSISPTKSTGLTSSSKTSFTLSQVTIRKRGEPPPFRQELQVEAISLKAFEKALNKHKKSGDMKKLACLEYFSNYFNEIAFFAITQPGSVQGVLGFGNPALVSGIKNCGILANLFPSISDLLAQNETFCGATESLRAEDSQSLNSIGFKQLAYLGVFPVSYKKELIGVWICTASTTQEIAEKELKKLKKLLSNLQFEPA